MCDAITLLPRCRAILLLVIDASADQEANRTRGKVERALERLRRAGVKLIDSALEGQGQGRGAGKELEGIRSLLAGIAQLYGSLEVSIHSCFF